ncbi:hypothetical protein H1R20_g13652, partial [Candolleomyces eurysporus]
MDSLIVTPFKKLCASGGLDPSTFPHVILIDGLDECSGEENQAALLASIKLCLLDNDLPFRVFIASRPEWAIRSALNSESQGYLHQLAYHIQLSDNYDATDDIRRYLWRRLRDIGSRSHDPRARSQSWPRKEDIEKLVVAASGQFVYAATVVKYASERRSSPVDRLQTVIDWAPEEGQLARPFEALDILYANVLSAAKELYDAVDTHRGRNFLLLLRAHHINSEGRIGNWSFWAPNFDALLNLERGAHDVLVSDLHCLVVFHPVPVAPPSPPCIDMCFYHQSFSEFLDSEIRAKNLFVPHTQVKQYVLEVIVQGIISFPLDTSTLGSTFGANAPRALSNYSDQGEGLSGPQLLSLARHNAWSSLDRMNRNFKETFALEGTHPFLNTISVIMRRLKDELKEPELADILRSYYEKWKETIENQREEKEV